MFANKLLKKPPALNPRPRKYSNQALGLQVGPSGFSTTERVPATSYRYPGVRDFVISREPHERTKRSPPVGSSLHDSSAMHSRRGSLKYWLPQKPQVAPYTYQEGAAPAIVNIAVALAVVGTVCLGLRILTRLSVLGHRTTGWSLLSAIISWALALPASVVWVISARNGLGSHMNTVIDNPFLPRALLLQWVGTTLSLYAVLFGKLAALLYIFEVQGPTHPRWRYFLISLLVVNFLLYIVLTPFLWFQCSPANTLWKLPSDTDADACQLSIPLFIYSTVAGSWGAFTDLAYAIYPAILISATKIPLRLKIGLSVLLGLGTFSAACAIVKTMLFCAFARIQHADQTYDNAGYVYWSAAEMWIILITGSIPPLWPTGKRCAQKLELRYGSHSGSSNMWPRLFGHFGKGHPDQSSDRTYTFSNTEIYKSQSGGGELERKSAARRYFYEYGEQSVGGDKICDRSRDPESKSSTTQQPKIQTRTMQRYTTLNESGNLFTGWVTSTTRTCSTHNDEEEIMTTNNERPSPAPTIRDGIHVTKDVDVSVQVDANYPFSQA